MVLCIDIGNTNIVLGGYENGAQVFCARMSTERSYEAEQYALLLDGILRLRSIAPQCFETAILSSVVPQVTDHFAQAVTTIAGIAPILLSQALYPDVRVCIDTPSELGADLFAGAVGAKAGYALPAIVMDLGTATKLTAIDANGAILGVSILPGAVLGLNALLGTASLLGGTALNTPTNAIGTDTAASLQSGIILGTASLLDGMVERFEAEMGPVKSLLATGGIAQRIVPHCKRNITHVPSLILDGLYEIAQAQQT